MSQQQCPWCRSPRLAPNRVAPGATEYRCQACGRVHTRKTGSPDAYRFFPGDVDRAVSDDPRFAPLDLSAPPPDAAGIAAVPNS